MVLLELSIFCRAANFFELDCDSSSCKSSNVSAEGMGLLGSGGGVSPSASSAIFRTYVNIWRSRDSCKLKLKADFCACTCCSCMQFAEAEIWNLVQKPPANERRYAM